jgi:hypothetical protein
MSFKQGVVSYMHFNLISWRVELNEDGDIVITVKDDKPLRAYYENLQTMVWFILAEIPHKAERVRMIVTNESRSNEYYYTFDPDRKRG